MTLREAFARRVLKLRRASWGEAAWLELEAAGGFFKPLATVHTQHMSPREVLVLALPKDGWEEVQAIPTQE